MAGTTAALQLHTAKEEDICYEVSRWEHVLFDARAKSGMLHDVLLDVSRNVAATKSGGSHALTTQLGTEMFARLYARPEKVEESPSLWRGEPTAWLVKVHELLDTMPEFAPLAEQVCGDPDMAALATAELLRGIADKLPELIEATRRDADDAAAVAKVRIALRSSFGHAGQRVSAALEAFSGLAPGLEAAPPMHEQVDPRRMALAERLLREPKMREILKRAGRISRLSRDSRAQRDVHLREEVVDIERGADLARILPAGLVRLRHPLLRKLALKEIVERQALQYRLEGRETLGRGPIVVLLDRSGSMSGDAELWASATAIALVGAATREHRVCTVVEFTASVDDVVRVAAGVGIALSSRDPSVALLGQHCSVAEVALQLASRRSSGGTNFGPVLRYGMACGVLDDRADLIIVTDGLADADTETLEKLTEAKSRGLRVWSLTVNGGSLSASIKAISDAAVDLDTVADIGAAIAEAMPND